jgi:hypothetical protein
MASRIGLVCLFLALLCLCGHSSAALYQAWELEAVDEQGIGTHPLVGAAPLAENRVEVEGIALNTTGEILDPDEMYTVFLQDETGGLQVWAGCWWYGDLWIPDEYVPVEAGDRVRVEGFLANHNGKVFINDRHSSAPEIRFVVTIVEKAAGMPDPRVIPAVSACNFFDQTRAAGGEKYQTKWCRLNGVEIVGGNWASGEELTISDGSGELTMLLSSQGDFDQYPPPTGGFDVIGIFDQEDTEEPYHDHYRIWVKREEHILRSVPLPQVTRAVKVQWLSKAEVTYQVYRSPDMETWDAVGDPVVGDGTTLFIFDDIEGAWKSFYKIEVQE